MIVIKLNDNLRNTAIAILTKAIVANVKTFKDSMVGSVCCNYHNIYSTLFNGFDYP